jgi:SAM-dependent methyltransferase
LIRSLSLAVLTQSGVKPPHSKMNIPNNWFEDFFHGVTLDLWRKAIPPSQTIAEAEFLATHLNCQSGAHLLDVPCGNGRLSFELAQRGFRVTGVDISEEFIEEARNLATSFMSASTQVDGTDNVARASGAGTGEAPVPQFILADMRNLDREAVYDGAYCFGNSFAFLGHAETENFLQALARTLKPAARFIIHTGMAAESVIPDFEEQSCHELGDLSITIKERYNAAESCIDSEYIFHREGQTESRVAREWIYTVGEMRRMLERAGFSVLDLYGSLKCEPYKLGSQELFIVSEMQA